MTIELMIKFIELPVIIPCLLEEGVIYPLCQVKNPFMQNSLLSKRQISICNKSLTGCDHILKISNLDFKT